MSQIRLTPLGGLYEFGNQSYLYRLDNTAVLVDAGAFFEDEKQGEINTRIMPDYNVLNNLKKLDAILITHNHEDHIGGLTYLLEKFPKVPVYCSPFVADNILIRARLEGMNVFNLARRIHKVGSYSPVAVQNNFRVEFIPVDHSVPEASMIYITTPQGNILHTGDWRYNKTDGAFLNKLHKIERNGLLALVADSTGINNTRDDLSSEEQIYKGLEEVFLKNKNTHKNFIFTTFSTHVERIASICKLAQKFTHRDPIFMGTSLLVNQIPAINRKMLPIRSLDTAKEIIPNNRFYIVSGSQAEPGSFLMKVISGEKSIEGKACIIMSASEIPSRKEKIHKMIDALRGMGHTVIQNDAENLTHMSGHATQSDNEMLIRTLGSRCCIVPVHGEGYHLEAMEKLANQLNVSNVIRLNKVGDTISFAKGVQPSVRSDFPYKKIEVQQRFEPMVLKSLIAENYRK